MKFKGGGFVEDKPTLPNPLPRQGEFNGSMLSLELGKNLSLHRRSSNLVNKYSIDAATTIPIAGKGPIGRKRQWPVAGLWVEVCDRVTPKLHACMTA